MRRPGVPTAVGILLFSVGMALVIDAGVIGGGVSASLADYVGAIAVLGALLVARRSQTVDRSNPEPPTVETKAELPVPGEEVDDLLAKVDADPLGNVRGRDRLRDRLTEVAVALLTDRYGLREAAVRETLEAGTWTDDPHAAAFFIGEYPEWAPLRLRLRDRVTFTGMSPSMQAEHVVTELLAVANGERTGLDRALTSGTGDGVDPGGRTGQRVEAETEAGR